MIGKLLDWLITKLFGAPYRYIKLEDGVYLKVKRGAASIVPVDEVPEHYHEEHEDDTVELAERPDPSMPNELMKKARIELLESKPAYEVASRAAKNQQVRTDVLHHPELVNADSEFEARLKLDIVNGEDIQSRIDANPKIAESDVEGMLETDFLAKWGYTQYGYQLPAKLNHGDANAKSAADTEADGGADSVVARTTDVDTGTGRPTVHASDIGEGAGETSGSGTGDAGSNLGGNADGGDIGGGDVGGGQL